jgi:hypothetical protein
MGIFDFSHPPSGGILGAMRPTPTWPDQRGAFGIAGPEGPSNIEMSGSRWPDIPMSPDMEDRRGDSQALAMLQALGYQIAPTSNYNWNQIKGMFLHPFTPVSNFTGAPLLPQGPLSRQAGYDDIGR